MVALEHILEQIKIFVENKNIITSIHRIQTYDSIMWGYSVKGKSLLDYTILVFPNENERNDKIIVKYFY